ncbi:MAG TPA: AAA family ATPase [Thermomicrobiaceae bacterium]|nr:AAA family ATPase [Thermomicrobiaceae bacterium]
MLDREEAAREHVARIVADLSRPEAYPDPTGAVALEETHASVVFLTDRYVYKVKKPVDFGFLDFSTFEKRAFYCREELRLNRRLTDGVYLDVVPVVEVGGRLQVFGEGPVVEDAVRMRRLPDDRMLAHLVDTGQVDESVFPVLAERLARFYREAVTGPGVDEWGTADAAAFSIQENVEQTQPYAGTIIAPLQLRLVDEVSREFFAREADLFARRLAEGRIREGHGDLHLAHICVLGDRPEDLQIIDGVEFNPRLRCGDVAVDVAFLAMDLDYHGRSDLARRFVALLAERLGDPELERLVHFFSIYRAHVRAKVACLRLDEIAPELPEYLPVKGEAERYIDLATSYMVEPARPTLFLVGGLSGTGKSVIARRLARALGASHVSSDVVRKALAGRAPESHEPAAFGAGIYSRESTERTYEVLLERAREALGAGRSIVLDATFLDPRWREEAARSAGLAGADMLLVECRCAPEVVQARLARRGRVAAEASEADWAVYQRQRERYGETLVAVDRLPQLIVDTDRPSAAVLDTLLEHVELRRRI